MKVVVSGSSGLIGSALVRTLTAGGVNVVRLVRTPPHMVEAKIHWDPDSGTIESEKLEGADAVIHLAGENIASGRWTKAKKARIRDSRVTGTRLLAEALTKLKDPPKAFLSASAVGYYGDRGDELLTEESEPGRGFLPEVCRDWEAATAVAHEDERIRVVLLRFGVVLSSEGGALKQMLGPFRKGIGGKIGNGRQFMSWVSVDDVVAAIVHIMANDSLIGPVNLVSPHAVTNRELTKTLGRLLHRPTIAPLPAFAARAMFGEMADAALLASGRAAPLALMESGYKFKHPKLEPALRDLLASTG